MYAIIRTRVLHIAEPGDSGAIIARSCESRRPERASTSTILPWCNSMAQGSWGPVRSNADTPQQNGGSAVTRSAAQQTIRRTDIAKSVDSAMIAAWEKRRVSSQQEGHLPVSAPSLQMCRPALPARHSSSPLSGSQAGNLFLLKDDKIGLRYGWASQPLGRDKILYV